MNITWKGSPNYNKRTRKLTKIVIHWFGVGTLESANTRFQNINNKVSAHYGISKGRIWQWVREENAAWHAGDYLVNQESIGIEHDAGVDPKHDLSEQDYQNSGQLVAEISKRWGIPLDRAHVLGHRQIKATQCPGTIDIDKIIRIAKDYLKPPAPVMKTKKLVVLLSHISTQQLPIIKQGIESYVDRVLRHTDNEFKIEIFYYNTDAQFYTEHGTSTDNNPIVYVRPIEQGIEAHKAEVFFGQEFDSACLIYDPQYIIGDQPTNPVQNPVVIEGINFFQIPTTWIGSLDPDSIFSARLFFGHENSHSDHFLVNYEGGLSLRDKTHDSNPYSSITPTADSDASEFFIDLLKELKPYWDYLTQGAGSTPVMLAFKFGTTVYVQVFSKFVPISDQDTFLELGGSWTYVKTLTQAEFDSIIKPYLAKTSVLG